jgi:hypothetical protein
MQEQHRIKPRRLKPTVSRLIFTEAIRQPKVPREFLASRLIKEIEDSGEIAPTLETCKRYISKARNSYDPLDQPWSLGACRDYPNFFPSSSLLFLLEFQKYVRTNWLDPETRESVALFSIRQAIWVTRLQPIIHKLYDQELLEPDDPEMELDLVYRISFFYSIAERTSETMGKDTFNTADFDDYLYSKNLDGFYKNEQDEEVFEEI